jgi:hypothetical protein
MIEEESEDFNALINDEDRLSWMLAKECDPCMSAQSVLKQQSSIVIHPRLIY